MLILAMRETLLWPLLDWSGAVLDAATLVFRAPARPAIERGAQAPSLQD